MYTSPRQNDTNPFNINQKQNILAEYPFNLMRRCLYDPAQQERAAERKRWKKKAIFLSLYMTGEAGGKGGGIKYVTYRKISIGHH
jgi:hypothetical protein